MASIMIIGGTGKVARLAVPKLIDSPAEVISVFRDATQTDAIAALGCQYEVVDVTTLDTDGWAQLVARADRVVWSAGAGGKGGAAATNAIDRDAAIACADACLAQNKPLIMVSFAGAMEREFTESDPLYTYAQAKRAADNHIVTLGEKGLQYVILGPTALTMDPATGVQPIDPTDDSQYALKTSRDLVADVITFYSVVDQLPNSVVDFADGDQEVDTLPVPSLD